MSVLDESIFDDDTGPDDAHAFGGVWTRGKLEALEKYLVAFNTAISKQSFTRIYIDVSPVSRSGMQMSRSASSLRTTRKPMSRSPTFTSQIRTCWNRPFAWPSGSPNCADWAICCNDIFDSSPLW